MHDDLTLYDADAPRVSAFDAESVCAVADWVNDECARVNASYALRVDMHRMHGVLRGRGITTADALRAHLTQHLRLAVPTGARDGNLFDDGGEQWDLH